MNHQMHFLGSPGQVADEIRAFDWSATSLGPIEGWPPALLTTLRQVLATRQPMCFWWGDDLLQFHNDAYLPILAERVSSALGQPFREYWSDVWVGVEPFVTRAMAGEGTWMENLPLRILRNGEIQESYWSFSYSPLYDDQGVIAGILNVVTETTNAVLDRRALQEAYQEAQRHLTEREQHEEELKLLNRELAHRMKNTLAMVQSIVTQSLRTATSIPDAAATIGARIQTLAKAQDVLTGMSVTAAEITTIAKVAVAPHVDDARRIEINGPRVFLSAQQALGLSLAIHELATNATKYGALSRPEGRVSIRWDKQADDRFTFDWQETGGPLVTEPTRRGFGSRLTERIVSDLFQGQAGLRFEPTGVAFSLNGKLHSEGDLEH
ncbi:PAS domain-containing sensor histidine kinase [Rhizobium sp. AG855]|uniref:sensor histidine kinase n=1 Tax=Rhizobium sp. AG855 TaxID=2183898 RepID=UPI000E74509D|nr:PAS domain-containing sensor histidine kinase [Rhizobium sp. AG855]RKE85932.1 two-component sensor histidine kinase [Rhizobium sp. AG855]